MSELNEWEQAVRSNNEPGLPNVILTLDEAKKWIEANPDEFNTCFVIFHKKNLEHGAGPDFDVSWHNAGLRYSELLGIFAYLTNYMCAEMGGRSH